MKLFILVFYYSITIQFIIIFIISRKLQLFESNFYFYTSNFMIFTLWLSLVAQKTRINQFE